MVVVEGLKDVAVTMTKMVVGDRLAEEEEVVFEVVVVTTRMATTVVVDLVDVVTEVVLEGAVVVMTEMVVVSEVVAVTMTETVVASEVVVVTMRTERRGAVLAAAGKMAKVYQQ